MIPAGVVEFPLEVTSYQDSVSEPNETVRVDLLTGKVRVGDGSMGSSDDLLL